MIMQRKAVDGSSQIKSVGHDPATHTLEVEFHNGGVYHYHGVDEEAHQAMMGAESIGSHFHKNIKNKHVCTKREGD